MTDPPHRRPDRSSTGTVVRVLSGRWLVVGMLGFGIAATAILWTYWKLQTAPFHPLQEAIAAKFPESRPRVEGGSHKGGPRIVRIVMRVDFDPQTDDASVQSVVHRVTELTGKYLSLSAYSALEIHLFWPEPEQRLHERIITETLGEHAEANPPENSSPE